MNDIVTRQELDLLAQTDDDLVKLTERILEATVNLLKQQPDLPALLEGKNRQQAIGDYIARKVRSREAKLAAENNIAEARLRLERELGLLIQRMQADGELARQGKPDERKGLDRPLKLQDLSITYKQSSTWQAVAALPTEKFENDILTAKENGWKITTSGIANHSHNHQKQDFKPLAQFVRCGIELDDTSIVQLVDLPVEIRAAIADAIRRGVKGFGVTLFEEKTDE